MHISFILLLQVVFLYLHPASTRVISASGSGLRTHEEFLRRSPSSANETRRSMIRRASTSVFQPPNTNVQPNGWVSVYTPILPFHPIDKSAADLGKFYELLQTEIKAVIAANYHRGEELELVDNQIRLDIRCFNHNNLNLVEIPDYQIVLDFLAYIVAKTKRGYCGRYRVDWVKANVTITFTLLLGALAVG